MNKQLRGGLPALLCLLLCILTAAARAESLYVVDQARNAVHLYNESNGGFVDAGDFAATGMNSPTGIAVGPDGFVYVVNSGDNTAHKFDSRGNDLGAVIFANINNPTAIAVNSAGQIAVANSGNNTVLFNGVPLSDGIDDPSALAFDSQGNLYIANRGSNTIRKYSGTTDLGDFAVSGLDEPTGLAIDGSGNVYAANYGDNTIHQFSAAGSDLGDVFLNNVDSPVALAYSSIAGFAVSNQGDGTIAPGIPGFGVITPYGLAFGPTPPVATLTGTLTFNGLSASAANQNVTFQFRDPNSGAILFTRTASVAASGGFSLLNVPLQNYTLWIKPNAFLAHTVSVTTSGSAFVPVTQAFDGGDANNDNSVDSSDFGIFIGAFNTDSSIAGGGYDPHADFNGDGFVDSTDFGILIGNFNQQGDP